MREIPTEQEFLYILADGVGRRLEAFSRLYPDDESGKLRLRYIQSVFQELALEMEKDWRQRAETFTWSDPPELLKRALAQAETLDKERFPS
jgi:hypothetical protein